MTVMQTAAGCGEELVASVEVRAAVARLVESGEVPVGCAPRPGDWTMPTCGDQALVLLLSPSPGDDEPIEDVHRSVDELERMLAL
jgi:hypothetical protein